jgi:hypothetical protein
MARVRTWRSVIIFIETGALALAVVLASLLGGCLLDFLLVLPWWVRALWLLATLGGAGLLMWKLGVLVRRQQPDDEAVALMIERGLPAFRSRFISAVQLARDAPTPLVRALVAETVAFARTQRLSAAIDKRAMWRALAVAAAPGLAGLALWFGGGGNGAPLLRRALLSTELAPRRTQLHMLVGNSTVGPGDDFKVEAGLSGAVPLEGRLHIKSATGGEQDLPIEADAAHPTHFTRALASVLEPFDYFVVLGDARSETFHVKVRPRPAIVSVQATQKFPTYTKLPPRLVALSELKLLAGSRLALRVRANVTVRSGAIRLIAGKQILAESPFASDESDSTQLEGEVAIPAKGVTGMTLRFVDADGFESRADTIYRIDVVADQPPTFKVRLPERSVELLTTGATMGLAFETRDDFGLAKIRMHYAVDWTEGAPSSAVDLDVGGEMPVEVMQSFDWKTAKLQPPVSEGQVIDYWLEATDTNEPAGIGVMKHYQLRIVSEFEKRADLANRLGDIMKGLGELRQGAQGVQARLGSMIEAISAGSSASELLGEVLTTQQKLGVDARKLVTRLEALLAEYERNKLTGVDLEVIKKMRDFLGRLCGNELQAVIGVLQKARATVAADAAGKALADAQAGQNQIIGQVGQVLAEYGRQQEGREFSQAFSQLADRQAGNLQKAIELSRRLGGKKTESLAAEIAGGLAEQSREQAALAAELKAVTEKIASFAKEPGHAEMTKRFQQAAADAQRVQPVADAAAAMLKEGQLYMAGGEEKTSRDALRRLARQTTPPLSPAEALHIAQRELGRMIAEETAIATQARDSPVQENLDALQNRQGSLAARSDLLAQDLVAQVPNAAQAIRVALEKMQDARGMLLDKAPADAAQYAQAALANLEKAHGEIAPFAMRAAMPSPKPATPNASPIAQQLAAAEKQLGELAKVIDAQQKLELETAKIVALARPKMNEELRSLDVRLADLRAETGNVKTALAGDPTDAVDALNDAGRDIGMAQSQMETPDGPGADATQRKILAGLYRAQRALNRKITQAAEQSGGNEAAQTNAMAQTSALVAEARAALAKSQEGFQKYEAARQAGQANARILQETAAVLAQAALHAGRAAAGSRVAGEATQQAMQEAAQDGADATSQAAAGRVSAAQEKAGSAESKLARAAIELALEHSGLVVTDAPRTSFTGPRSGASAAPQPGTQVTPSGRALNFSGLPARERAVLEQAKPEKYPAEYGERIEQYLRNLAEESAEK